MPLYEYKCVSCGHRFERIERASSRHDGVCPVCDGAAERQLGAPALQFKGSGWYVNDYAADGAPKPTGNERESATRPSAASEADSGSATDAASKKPAEARSTPKVA